MIILALKLAITSLMFTFITGKVSIPQEVENAKAFG
jgi:hypothetical protein